MNKLLLPESIPHLVFHSKCMTYSLLKQIITSFPRACLTNMPVSHSVMSNSSWSHELEPTRLLYPLSSPVKNSGVGCHSLLQRIFLTQEQNLGLLHSRQIVYWLSYQGSTHRFNKYLLRTYYVLGTVIDAGNTRLLSSSLQSSGIYR